MLRWSIDMPYIQTKFYLVVLFCGCHRCFPYFNSPCTAIHIGDVVVCEEHKVEQIIKEVNMQEAK